MKVNSLCKLRELFFKKSECLHVTGSLVARSTRTPPLSLGVDAHHSAIALWSASTQSFLYAPALQCPLPHHSIKNCFPLGNLTEYMRFPTGEEKPTQVLPGPPARIPTDHGSGRMKKGRHTGKNSKESFALLPIWWPRSIYYILIPLLGPGTHWGQDGDESPSRNTPSASGKLKKKKKKCK